MSLLRTALLTSAAGFGLTGTAQAQQADFAPELSAQADAAAFAPELEAQGTTTFVGSVAPDPQIVIGFPNTTADAVDTTDINGVGQMTVANPGGGIGLCTATLINPRTVIFAAHCVNDYDAADYGRASGGVPIAFGFSADNLPGVRSWYLPGEMQFQTNTDLAIYNADWVSYITSTLEPGNGFLYGDIAMASLDTPAEDIPTWALLFSALPAQNLGAEGTGYHVTLTGYGNRGTGTTGSNGGIDWRRRSAENMLGALASLDDFQNWLFGGNSTDYPQNLYWIDFDDPRRGTVGVDPRDFNAWRDNPLPREGITASGDSGGPLILDNTFDIPLVIGVLSGGYTRFFGGAPANGYGTTAFYQPLYLYWDWVAANNPYHYVSAKAGNGDWMDPTHWVSEQDPNYFIIGPDGQLVNGVPGTPGAGTADEPGFGQQCFESGGVSQCRDIATGEETFEFRPIGTSVTSLPAVVRGTGLVAQTSPEAQATGTAAATPASHVLPGATIDNGLPGATNFVPVNLTGGGAVKPRFFDVTLYANGTTTLSDHVTVDRFTLMGAGAALDIKTDGALTSLMDINQYAGMMRVDGSLITPGDYMLMFGGLQGRGHIYTPFFTNVAGVIAPGGMGSVGTLTIHGNAILSSGSTFVVDLGNNGVSDRLQVVASTFDMDGVPTDGMASLGGNLVFGMATGQLIRDGSTYTILTAEGGISGTFNTPLAISAILTPTVTYTEDSVMVSVDAGSYASVVDQSSLTQRSYAYLLDQNRELYAQFSDLYGLLDLQDQATIRAQLEALAPRAQSLIGPMGLAFADTLSQLRRDRVGQYERGATGGTLARFGRPIEMAAADGLARQPMAGDESPMVADNALPENLSAYLAGGYVTGDAMAMGGIGSNDFDGWYASLGLEAAIGDYSMVGVAASYADSSGDVTGFAQGSDANLYQLAVYGKYGQESGLTLDGQFSMGIWDMGTTRQVSFLGTPYTVTGQKDATLIDLEIGISKAFGSFGGFQVTPRLALRETWLDVGQYRETGAPFALQSNFPTYRNEQARAGLIFDRKGTGLRPYIEATYVHDFNDKPAVFGAGFVGGTGASAPFALAGTDQDWGELSGKLSYDTGKIDLSVMAKTTVLRDDFSVQSYSASATIRF